MDEDEHVDEEDEKVDNEHLAVELKKMDKMKPAHAIHFALIVVICLFAPVSAVAEETKRSLDAQLLDDLDNELLNDLRELPPVASKTEPQPAKDRPIVRRASASIEAAVRTATSLERPCGRGSASAFRL